MIVIVIFDNGFLWESIGNGDYARFTFMQSGSGTWPIHAIADRFVPCKTKIADFQLSTTSASSNVGKILWNDID